MGIRNTWRLAFCFLLWIAAFAPRLARAGTDSPRPPEVSIVIPANNEAANLPPLVDKIMRLPLSRGFEVVLVDDASTDDTPRIAQRLSARYPNFVYVRTGTSSGQGGGRCPSGS
jgi:cellulose synthase/poly-beta-1,6-N-acetylglucosamine synthase-like glycosyltransferase